MNLDFSLITSLANLAKSRRMKYASIEIRSKRDFGSHIGILIPFIILGKDSHKMVFWFSGFNSKTS